MSKMQDFLLMFDDYNYKMLNDDVRRVINVMKQDVEKYNYEKLRNQIMAERESKNFQSRKLLDVYMLDAGSPKARRKGSS